MKTVTQNSMLCNTYNQGSPRYLASGGGANSENFKNSGGGGGKLNEFNG